MPALTTLGNTALGAIGRLPYFRGKGLLALAVMRLCQSAQPLTLPLPNGCRMALYNDNTGQQLITYWIGKYERETIPVFQACVGQLAMDEVVIDAGANAGYFALLAAGQLRHHGGVRVHAFEPNPQAFRLLAENAQLNRLPNLLINRTGLADSQGKLDFHVNPEITTWGSLRPFADRKVSETLKIEVTRLDEYAATLDGRVGLIKLDVEGSELLVLRGAAQTIDRQRPYILYEEYGENFEPFGYTAAETRQFLRARGYLLYALQPPGPALQAAADDTASGPWQNILAVPPGRALPAERARPTG